MDRAVTRDDDQNHSRLCACAAITLINAAFVVDASSRRGHDHALAHASSAHRRPSPSRSQRCGTFMRTISVSQ
jgi:hypothetical protein